jgi:hypothetical protein
VTGLPVIAIFAMGQNRTVQTLMMASFIACAGALVSHRSSLPRVLHLAPIHSDGSAPQLVPWHRPWIRNILNLIIFHAFVLYINWMRETADRRLHVLRDQLKTQYKQTQKAQISERKSSDSKRRLTSYIFHVSARGVPSEAEAD